MNNLKRIPMESEGLDDFGEDFPEILKFEQVTSIM